MKDRISKFLSLGFSREQAERIEEGFEIEALTEEEVLIVAHAWENDKVEPLKPLVEKYGWEEMIERLNNSLEKCDKQ